MPNNKVNSDKEKSTEKNKTELPKPPKPIKMRETFAERVKKVDNN